MVHVATYLAYLKGKGPGLVASAISGVCLVHAILSFERKGKMQATKDAAASMKESAANAMASAKSGMDKTKATAREKMETVSTHDPVQKQMAKEKKQEKIHDAEAHKQEARQHNAAAKQNAHSD